MLFLIPARRGENRLALAKRRRIDPEELYRWNDKVFVQFPGLETRETALQSSLAEIFAVLSDPVFFIYALIRNREIYRRRARWSL